MSTCIATLPAGDTAVDADTPEAEFIATQTKVGATEDREEVGEDEANCAASGTELMINRVEVLTYIYAEYLYREIKIPNYIQLSLPYKVK